MVFIVATNSERCIVNRGSFCNYKLGQELLQIGGAITNRGNCYKLMHSKKIFRVVSTVIFQGPGELTFTMMFKQCNL